MKLDGERLAKYLDDIAAETIDNNPTNLACPDVVALQE